MALTAYLTLKGQKQGDIHSSVTQKGHENSILVHAFSHEVDTPRDPASGLATGKRMHKPVAILKEIDKSSPPLWTALVTNENLVAWELKFSDTSASSHGTEKEIYTIRLVNASISSIRESMLDNQVPANANLPLREEISFTYQKIEWIWTDGQIAAGNSWEPPV